MRREGERKIHKHSERREARLLKASSKEKNPSPQSVIHSACVMRDGAQTAPEGQLDEVCDKHSFLVNVHVAYMCVKGCENVFPV